MFPGVWQQKFSASNSAKSESILPGVKSAPTKSESSETKSPSSESSSTSKLEEHVETLIKQLASTTLSHETAVSSAKSQVLDLKNDLMSQDQRIDVVKSQVLDLKNDLMSQDQRIDAVKSQVLDLKNDLMSQDQRIDAVETSLKAKFDSVVSMIDEFSSKEDKVVESTEFETQSAGLRTEFQTELEARETSLKLMIDKSIKSSSTAIKSNLNEQIARLDVAIVSLRGKLNSDEITTKFENDMNILRDRLANSEAQIAKLLEADIPERSETEVDSLTKQINELGKALEDTDKSFVTKLETEHQEIVELIEQKIKHFSETFYADSGTVDDRINIKFDQIKNEIQGQIELLTQSKSQFHDETNYGDLIDSRFKSQNDTIEAKIETVIESYMVTILAQIESRIQSLFKSQTEIMETNIGAAIKLHTTEILSEIEPRIESQIETFIEKKMESWQHEVERKIIESSNETMKTMFLTTDEFNDIITHYLKKERIDAYMTSYIKKEAINEIVKPLIVTELTRKISRSESPKHDVGDASPPPLVKTIGKAPIKRPTPMSKSPGK